MEISPKSITLFLAVVLTGLSAGLFYAWSVSVIPGTKKVPDHMYLETMQAINRAILNPGFFLIYMGSLGLLAVSTFQQFQNGLVFWLLLVASITYLVGTFGVTGLGNVPLNNSLDVLDLGQLSKEAMATTRQEYELAWNRFHTIRMAFSVLAFLLSLMGVFTQIKTA
jgi:uncharacterized membrane protein